MGWMPLGLIAIWLGAGEKRKRQAHDRHIGPASELKPAQPDSLLGRTACKTPMLSQLGQVRYVKSTEPNT
jgi:hypothetical protein